MGGFLAIIPEVVHGDVKQIPIIPYMHIIGTFPKTVHISLNADAA